MSHDYRLIKQTHWNPTGFVFLWFIYGILWASTDLYQGHFVVYPFYLDTAQRALMVTGSWLYMYCVIWVGETQLNHKFDEHVLNFVSRTSMYVFISHDIFCTILVTFIFYPLL